MYVGDSYAIRAFDVRDPRAPIPLGAATLSDWFSRAAFAGSYAYLATLSGIVVVDVADPGAMREVAHHETVDYATDVVVVGDYVYVSVERHPIQIYRCSGS